MLVKLQESNKEAANHKVGMQTKTNLINKRLKRRPESSYKKPQSSLGGPGAGVGSLGSSNPAHLTSSTFLQLSNNPHITNKKIEQFV